MSYNTVDEADSYVASHYLATDAERLEWEKLDEDSKAILLTRSKEVIDNLPLRGRKSECTQPDAFPRDGQTVVPEQVKAAEVELAIALSDTDAKEVQNQYQKMVDYGISSYSIGNFSESILAYQKNSVSMLYGLISNTAERLLQPWMGGGFCIE